MVGGSVVVVAIVFRPSPCFSQWILMENIPKNQFPFSGIDSFARVSAVGPVSRLIGAPGAPQELLAVLLRDDLEGVAGLGQLQ